MTRSSTLALAISFAQIFAAVPPASASSRNAEGPDGGRPTLSADTGARPYTPARSGGETTSVAPNAWAAPGAAVETLPLPSESAAFHSAWSPLPSGFPRSVDRPPKPLR